MKIIRKKLHTFRRGQKGFTLIELLVIIGIIGVLSAVAIPNVTKFINRGQTEAADTELANVQAAVDGMMADKKITSFTSDWTGDADATSNMSTFPTVPYKLYPDYMRTATTKGTYWAADDGTVHQATTGY